MSGALAVKLKTKAKTRYLKRKKLRRTARKAAAPKRRKVQEQEDPTANDESDSSDEQDADQDEGQHDPGSPQRNEQEFVGEEERPSGKTPESRIQANSQLPSQGGFPSFPAPVAPQAPSKSELAIQGVDKALVHAEIINPATVVPILPSGADEQTGLGEKTRKRLLELGITELFAVQTALLPFLITRSPSASSLYPTFSCPRDACVSAPTGSGKTLAYVLPIIEVLSSRVITRLRALIVLPTRDLVTQVRETFEAIGKGRGLKMGSATGQQSFAHEQAQLVGENSVASKGGISRVDILICTPGRLMDHLNGTPNFSLQHLRFLVIDEADRLLAQSFHDWLAQVLAACDPRRYSGDNIHDDSLSPAFLQAHASGCCQADVDEMKDVTCQKLLFSATLTQDPGKLASLGLRDPKYFVVQSQWEACDGLDALDLVSERFTMPATLTEHMIVCEPSQKPLMLLHLIYNFSVRSALVFTKSSESTTRLVRLIEFFQQESPECDRVVVRACSSDLPPGERKSILEKFKAREIHLLVCSDLVSRGVDISHVAHVVSYDAPVELKKYVHRVGRTARAGRAGDAWTLVEQQEARYFKTMLRENGHLERVKRVKIAQKETEGLLAAYQTALQRLKEVYTR